MITRYTKKFEFLKKENRTAFIPFTVAGDPNIEQSESIIKAYIDSGADILEIGFPFSDPSADGPVNQKAALRAINSGISHSSFFSLIKKIRSYTDIPIGILLYANTINYLGFNAFCKKAKDSGIDSLLVADMPPEESSELLSSMKKYNLESVFIVSELTSYDRIRFIAKHTTGFIYVVSRLGITGVQKDFNDSVKNTIKKIRTVTDLPLCVGFGLSTPKHIKQVVGSNADGAIVGSRLVKIIDEYQNDNVKLITEIKKVVRTLANATH